MNRKRKKRRRKQATLITTTRRNILIGEKQKSNSINQQQQQQHRSRCAWQAADPSRGRANQPIVGLAAVFVFVLLVWQTCFCQTDTNSSSSFMLRTSRGQIFQGVRLKVEARDDHHHHQVVVVGFLGVRYAGAPIRRLRFMPPTPFNYAPHQVTDAQSLGPICMQRLPVDLSAVEWALKEATTGGNRTNMKEEDQQDDERRLINHYMRLVRKLRPANIYHHLRPIISRLIKGGQGAHFHQSEDCLNLNIFVPLEALRNNQRPFPAASRDDQQTNGRPPMAVAANGSLLPVLVLIHGDSLDFGSGNLFDVRRYVHQHHQLVVTINYRLNIFGFPPAKWGSPGSASNLGLLDQLAALHWIQANIRSFGGSPDQVTLMGVRRGSTFAHLLMLSPLAKGLFKRAILEDGTALSPMLANQLHPQASKQSDYIRVLAKLSDCPTSSSSSSPSMTMMISQMNNPTGQVNGGANLSQVAADEPSMGAIFECLRQRPAQQIMQRIPVELLQSSQQQQQQTILTWPATWQRPVNELLTSRPPPPSSSSSSSSPATSSEHLNGRQLELLINLATLEQVERSISEEQDDDHQPREDKLENSSNRADLDGLFEALHRQQRPDSMRPLFGPHLDATITKLAAADGHDLNGQSQADLAGAILSSGGGDDHQRNMAGSLFAGRDLLIGTTHPLDRADSTSALKEPPLGPSHLLADYYTAKNQEEGLDEEQAIGQVNLFVKTFYRFHQQEISNSIVEHYLTGGWKWRSPVTTTTNRSTAIDDGPNQTLEEQEFKRNKRQHQVALLNSLTGAFQDALINVPVLKTALVHSVKQLDSVAGVFVAEQYEKLAVGGRQQADHPSKLINDKTLLSEFISFASRLFNDPSWPLELRQQNDSAAHLEQPHSTYLYQFDADLFIRSSLQIGADDEPNDAGQTSNLFDHLQHQPVLWQVKSNLNSLLARLNRLRPHFKRTLGLSCAFDVIDSGDSSDQDFDNRLEPEDRRLISQVEQLICSKSAQTLANFVATGNVNNKHRGEVVAAQPAAPGERISNYISACMPGQPSNATNPMDHHSVNVIEASSKTTSCKRQLDQLTLDYLESRSANVPTGGDSSRAWPVFNVFSQQIATLTSPAGPQLGSLVRQSNDNLNKPGEESHLLAKSLFWSNFVQALNCSRTQPLSLAPTTVSGLNSTLLNLNLLSNNCQWNQVKTINQWLAALGARMKQQLLARLSSAWSSSSSSSLSASNRENEPLSKRMSMVANLQDDQAATGLGDNTSQADNGNDPGSKQQSSNHLNGSLSLLTVDSNLYLSASGFDLLRWARSKRALVSILGVSLLVSLALFTATYAIVRHNRRKRLATANGGSKLTVEPQEGGAQQNCHLPATSEMDPVNGQPIGQEAELTLAAARFLPAAVQWHEHQQQQQQQQQQSSPAENTNNNQTCSNHSGQPTYNHTNTSFSVTDQSNQPDLSLPIMLPLIENNNQASLNSYEAAAAGSNSSTNTNQQVPIISTTDGQESVHHQPGCSMFLLATDGQLGENCTGHQMDYMEMGGGRRRRAGSQPRSSLSASNGHYGGSSSETTTTTTTNTATNQNHQQNNQSNSLASSNKKRVKISDPLGASRSASKLLAGGIMGAGDNYSLNLAGEQVNYCPVHRTASYQTIQLVNSDDDYYPTGSGWQQGPMLIQHQHEYNSLLPTTGSSINLLDQQLVKQNQLYHRTNQTNQNIQQLSSSFNQTLPRNNHHQRHPHEHNNDY